MKRGTAMPRLSLEVVGNLRYRCRYSSPRYSVRTTMPSLVSNLKISYVSKLQDKHNASSFFVCLEWSRLNPSTKVIKNSGNSLFPSDFLCVEVADGARFWLLAVPFFPFLSSAVFLSLPELHANCSPAGLSGSFRHCRRFCGMQNLYLLPGNIQISAIGW